MKKIQTKYRDLPGEDMVRIICRVAENQKALDLVALDVRKLAGFADYFVIMAGTSTRHVQGLADVIDREIASKRMKSAETEGLNEGEWILLDYNDVIVHIFHHEIRAHYDLEGLWHDAPRLDLSQPAPVVEEPAVKKAKKKTGRQLAVKTAGQAAARPAAKKAASSPAKPARKPSAMGAKATGKKGPAKPAKKASGKPTGRVSGKPSAGSTGKPVGKSSKPASRPAGKPVSRSSKPTSRPAAKPLSRTSKPAGKPAGRAAGRPVKKSATPRRGGSGGAKK